MSKPTWKDELDHNWRHVSHVVRHTLFLPFEWVGIGCGVFLMSLLPHAMLLRVCDVASAVYYAFDFNGRALARKNLRLMFGEGRLSERMTGLIIRRSYRNMARTIGHAFWTCFDARRKVEAVGIMDSRCAKVLAEHCPLVTVSAHMGCWEILSQLAYLHGHTMMSVAKRIGTRGMTRLLMHARKSIGQEIVHADGAFKSLMQGLKDGKSLGLLVDQKVSPRKGGIWVKFFGCPMPVSAAPAFFAAKAKVPIIVAWSRPLKDGRYRCEYIADYDASATRDIWALTQSVAEDLERMIRRHPSCWILNYDYFCRQPLPEEREKLEARFQDR